MMKRHLVLFLLMISVSLLAGQSVQDSGLMWNKLKVERLPDMNLPRAGHTVFYAGNELTVVGGHTSGFVMTPTAEYYSDGVWHLIPTVYPHDNGMAVMLDDGKRVLIAGGHEKNLGIGQSFEVEMYTPESHTFDGFGCLDRKRAFAQGVELDSGRVLITGNHQGNDAFEMFDGKKQFRQVKEVTTWRSMPYVLPIAPDDAITFGAVWRGRFEPCDTVDRLKGEPFCAPLLKEWMPLVYDQNSHVNESFIGDETTGDYSYIIAAQHSNGEIAFIHIHDTVFTLLPTTCPVPTTSEWGSIKYDRSAIADRQAGKVYLVGNDNTGRAYVVAMEYDKQPAPLTFYYTDPLLDFGDATPVLTSEGDLIITGGIIDDNFAPFATAWLLQIGERETALVAESSPNRTWLWVLCGLLLVGVLVVFRHYRNDIQPQPQKADDELMTQITQLMETQHLYLNPNLQVNDVANALGVHRNAVSASINAQQGCSFNQFINNYRVEKAKMLLCELPNMKISTVGLESGFSNERTFFRVFKEATGMTPKEWVTKQQK